MNSANSFPWLLSLSSMDRTFGIVSKAGTTGKLKVDSLDNRIDEDTRFASK